MDEEPESFDFVKDKNQLLEDISLEVQKPKVNKNRIICHKELKEKANEVKLENYFLSESTFQAYARKAVTIRKKFVDDAERFDKLMTATLEDP